MAGGLLQQIVKSILDRHHRRLRRALGRQLSRRQPQVQRHRRAFARRTLLHHTLQVQQFGAKNLQPLAQFFDQVVDFFFEIGRLAQLIADVDIHAKPQSTGSGSREALSSLLIGFYTRDKSVELQNSCHPERSEGPMDSWPVLRLEARAKEPNAETHRPMPVAAEYTGPSLRSG